MSFQNPGLVSITTDSQATAVGLSFPTREPHLTDHRDHRSFDGLEFIDVCFSRSNDIFNAYKP